MTLIKGNWYDLINGATVGMFGYIVSNSPKVALIIFFGATLVSCALFTKETTKEDTTTLKIGLVLSTIIITIVTAGQLIIPNFIVKGEPTHSALFAMGFLLFLATIYISEKINYDMAYRIYVGAVHIQAYHLKESHWYDTPFGAMVGAAVYIMSNSAPFALIAFGMGTLLSYATEFFIVHRCFGKHGVKMYCHFCSKQAECHDKKTTNQKT